MRPFRSFLLLLIFLVVFAGLSYLIPWDLNLPNAGTLFPEELVNSLYLKHKTSDSQPVTQPAETLLVAFPERIIRPDSVYPAVSPSPVPVPLRSFSDSLNYSRRPVRIMYYGDSQIEGDRITSYLRYSLRKTWGGTGPGLFLPVMPVTYTRSVYVRASSNWKRYNYLSFRNGTITHNALGPFMSFCRYMPEGAKATSAVRSWIRIVPSVFADSTSSKYDYLRILYRNSQEEVKIDVRADKLPVYADTLRVGPGLNEFVCPLYNARNILIDFSGKVSPDIYGISIEGSSGIIVDNIPQRGSAGLEFTMIDKENLSEAFRILSPDLVILHFGLNIVRNVRRDYSYYEKGLARQLTLLKEIAPGASIVVVGLTDMAYGEEDKIVSYPNIPGIINAQKTASNEAGVMFWDALKAMGGQSSIIKWFNMNPPLAKKDYVHFTDQGADTLGHMMMSELFAMEKPGYLTMEQKDTIPPSITAAGSNSENPVAGNSPDRKVAEENQAWYRQLASGIFSYNPEKPFIFTAPAFWIFFLAVLLLYSLFYRRLVLRNLYLFLVSLFFYYKTGGFFLFILIFVTVVDYTCGILIHRSERKGARRFFLLLSIISNLVLLGYFKYTGFIIESINSIFDTHLKVIDLLSAFSNSILGTSFDISYIILPVGISFFTFQSLSYTIDVYRRKMEPVRNIIDFGFYVSFFPHLVAGPIVRASVFIPQIYQEFRVTHREFSHALFMISKGLIKKIVISNYIAVNLVDRVFDVPSVYSGFENLMAVYGYGLQIYCDFSGYTDIAIGIALILGFRLPLNFNSPYKAASISDFWKRWHISLSQWLRDYLYISLGGNRKGKIRTIINLMITMLLGGLWHGASLRFIIWGGLHGIGLAVNRIFTFIFGERTFRGWFWKALSIFLTFQFVSFCWIFFRAPDMHSVVMMLRQIFENFMPASFNVILPVYAGVFSLMAAGYLIHFLPEKLKESYRGVFIRIPLPAQMAIMLIIGIMLYQMRTTEIMPFIYFRF